MSAPVDDEEKLIAQSSGQHVVDNTDPGEAPAILSAPRGDMLVSKPEMHSAQKIVPGGIPMEEVVCLEPLMTSVPDAPLDSKQTSRPMEGVTSPAPSRHSVMQLHLDSQASNYQSQPDRSRYPIPDDIPHRQLESPGNQTVPDFVVNIDVNRGGYPMPDDTPCRKVCFYDSQTVSNGINNNAVQTAPSELAEHSTSGEMSELLILKPAPAEYTEQRRSKERSLSEVPLKIRQGPAQIDQPE